MERALSCDRHVAGPHGCCADVAAALSPGWDSRGRSEPDNPFREGSDVEHPAVINLLRAAPLSASHGSGETGGLRARLSQSDQPAG